MSKQPSAYVQAKLDRVAKRTVEIERLTNEQKGFLLLDNVRNLAFASGVPEEHYIALFCEFGGFMEASALCTERMLSEDRPT